jgi:transcription elongation factor Elf1
MEYNKGLDTNHHGIYSIPFKLYSAIKLSDGTIRNLVTRTRNMWHTKSGSFVEYDQFVVDIQQEYYCPSCGRVELLWQSDFTKENEYVISCDYCKELTFLKPVYEDSEEIQRSLFDIYLDQLSSKANFYNYWVDSDRQILWVTFRDSALQNYKVKLVFSSDSVGFEKVEFNMFIKNEWEWLYIPIGNKRDLTTMFHEMFHHWLNAERENISNYFEIVGSL